MIDDCIVCGSRQTRSFYAGLRKCTQCGHIFADLRLTEEELFRLYHKSYFFGDEYVDYVGDKEVLQKNFMLRFNVLQKFIDFDRQRHLLEVGSAYGFFLEIVKDRFETVQGIDITEDGVRYAREQLHLNVVHGDLLKHDWQGRNFDVICMWDTIEHLHNPHHVIEGISGLAEPGALLAITTGDIGSINARIKGDSWRLIHPPTHVHYFSRKTLSQLLDRCGFEVVYSRHCGFYRSLNNIAYNMLILRSNKRSLYNVLRKLRLTDLSLYLNLYDIMYVIARKRQSEE